MLVLGGTSMVGRAVAAAGVAAGYEVVCGARGESGAVPAGARLVPVDRDGADPYAPLADERFDAVFDMATMSYPWVSDALRALAGRAAHWTFVSSANVYADTASKGQDTDAPLVEPRYDAGPAEPSADPAVYGAVKVASERAVLDAFGSRAFVVRPGLIVGPDDRSDRFGYWPARFERGGRALVPDVPEQPIQYVDVRDLADWLLLAARERIAGVYDAVGPARPLPELLREIAGVLNAQVELVPRGPAELFAAGINPWAGPRSLPMWLPDSHLGLAARAHDRAARAGLAHRPLADTVRAALAREHELGGLVRSRIAGLTPEEETTALA